MSILYSADASAVSNPTAPSFFASPEPAGRRIVCGFSYIQRIAKSAVTDVWFPAALKEKVAARVLAGDETVLEEFQVEWAAVRQFELLQESDNYYIYDLKVEHFARAYEDILKMRARGYRITVITMGNYVEPQDYDELRILDAKLQEEITQMIQMLYLEEQSLTETKHHKTRLFSNVWDYAQALPHIAMTLGAADLFAENEEKKKKKKGESGDARAMKTRQQKLSQAFFRILEKLPQKHIAHDVAVGLTLPELIGRQSWIYCAPGEFQYTQFQTALANVFRMTDHISLGALHERAGATSEAMPVMHHMRGYGDRNPAHEEQNRQAALYLREAGALSLN